MLKNSGDTSPRPIAFLSAPTTFYKELLQQAEHELGVNSGDTCSRRAAIRAMELLREQMLQTAVEPVEPQQPVTTSAQWPQIVTHVAKKLVSNQDFIKEVSSKVEMIK